MKRVLVQAGHAPPREPGFESGTGTIREIELTTELQKRLVSLLNRDTRFKPIPVPGDIPDGIRVDAAIFLHGDGSANPTATGYSFGFPNFAVNARLAALISAEFQKIPGHPPHHEDNYTGGLREYYGYRRVDTAGPEVLVEHGFLTNPRERNWIFTHLDELARAEYVALCRFFGFQPLGTNPEEDDMTKARALELEQIAERFRAGGDGPGPLTEAENAVYFGYLRQYGQGHDDGTAEAAPELTALRVKIANAKVELDQAKAALG